MEWRWLVGFRQVSQHEPFVEDDHSYQIEPAPNKANEYGGWRTIGSDA
jgi:hypothetical protein